MMSVNYLCNVYTLTSLWYTETISTIHHVFEQCSATQHSLSCAFTPEPLPNDAADMRS